MIIWISTNDIILHGVVKGNENYSRINFNIINGKNYSSIMKVPAVKVVHFFASFYSKFIVLLKFIINIIFIISQYFGGSFKQINSVILAYILFFVFFVCLLLPTIDRKCYCKYKISDHLKCSLKTFNNPKFIFSLKFSQHSC